PDHLQHQELVEVRIDQAANDRVELPGMVIDPARNVGLRHTCPVPAPSGACSALPDCISKATTGSPPEARFMEEQPPSLHANPPRARQPRAAGPSDRQEDGFEILNWRVSRRSQDRRPGARPDRPKARPPEAPESYRRQVASPSVRPVARSPAPRSRQRPRR